MNLAALLPGVITLASMWLCRRRGPAVKLLVCGAVFALSVYAVEKLF